MTKKEKLLRQYLKTHTLADYKAYESCPEDAVDESKIRDAPETEKPKASRKKKG